jgi:sugar phosphate isomerase/epimerase
MATWAIGNMLWRIGDVLDFDRQLAWTFEAGFAGIGFHASAGIPGQWRGIEPATCGAAERLRLHKLVSQFAFAEVHAPFRIELQSDNLAWSIAELVPVLELAGDLGAAVVTVHAQVPDSTAWQPSNWLAQMKQLSIEARQRGLTIGLEIVEGFDAVRSWNLPNIGVTLDIGHMHVLEAGRRSLASLGGLGAVIRYLDGTLRHLHVHDVCAGLDHGEVGTGSIDFRELIAALEEIGYRGNLTLELNPDRVSPEGIRRSKDYLMDITPTEAHQLGAKLG